MLSILFTEEASESGFSISKLALLDFEADLIADEVSPQSIEAQEKILARMERNADTVEMKVKLSYLKKRISQYNELRKNPNQIEELMEELGLS